MKILTIIGARPQFIKAGTLSREIVARKNAGIDISEIIVHTGQHYDSNMSDIFFEQMKIPMPNYFLHIGGGTHSSMTGQMMEKIEEVLFIEKPDWVLVYGDTNSTLAGALAASKLNIKIAHVEAGLRSFNMNMPEEVNRILTDRVSTILFCPTETAVNNLNSESFPFKVSDNNIQKIVNVGDVMQDGAIFYKQFAQKPSFLDNNKIDAKDFVLCTIHRAENTSDPEKLKSIFESLNEIGLSKKVVLPLHPRTKKIIEDLSIQTSNILIIDPVGYLEMVWLIDNCAFVMTDSGGLQKEAYFFNKQCITLRDETEWVELIECGANILVGSNKNRIIDAFQIVSSRIKNDFNQDLYGNGQASTRIIDTLLSYIPSKN
jgi:UDP-GlcNAc3NAcA epimerase